MDDRLTVNSDRIELRPATEQDREFLLTVYASTRTEELALTDWPDEQKRAFVRMQFDAQDAYYREKYLDASFFVIEKGQVPIGRLYTARLIDEIRVIDIALLPEYRGQGSGSQLISGIIDQARREAIAVRLHVEPWNPAKGLYERFGFRTVTAGPVYELMELVPGPQLKTAS